MIRVEEISTKLCLHASREGAKGKNRKKKRSITQTPAKAKLTELLFPLDYQKLDCFSSKDTKRK